MEKQQDLKFSALELKLAIKFFNNSKTRKFSVTPADTHLAVRMCVALGTHAEAPFSLAAGLRTQEPVHREPSPQCTAPPERAGGWSHSSLLAPGQRANAPERNPYYGECMPTPQPRTQTAVPSSGALSRLANPGDLRDSTCQ